jgi:pimeloyl-ACP methyl ester carboxylesterase
MSKTARYKDGETLAFAEYGDLRGYPILVQHGLIASIRNFPLFDSLLQAGTRLVCIARPGYGRSSPYRIRNIGEWGDIVAGLVNELDIAEFDVLGMSSGAPYSYAIGSRLPDRTRNIFIFSGTPALYDERVLVHWPYPTNKNASIGELEQLAEDLFFAGLTTDELQRADIVDSRMNHCFGIAQDLKVRCLDWGFTLADLRTPVYMQHSELDEAVPLVTAEITAGLLLNCRLEVREKGGHFSDADLDEFIRSTMLPHYDSAY